ncbi:hypothetical protein Gpo141_00005145 [Globisporangium polare]
METLATGAAELSPWVELFDEASGFVYYYNTETMESSWEKPGDEQQEEEELEWLECWDENAGASYFYNTKTGEATWTTPEGMDYEPEALLDGNANQSLDAGLYGAGGGPEMGGGVVFRTLPPKSKAAMAKRNMLDNSSNQAPEAMFRTAPPIRSTLNPSVVPEAYPDNSWDGSQDANAVSPELYEYAYDESAVDTEYDINYKIFMTQLERDSQQQQQGDDEVHQNEPDDQQERQQQQEGDQQHQ